MNNGVLTDEEYKGVTSRKEKHLVSARSALGRRAQPLMGAGGRVRPRRRHLLQLRLNPAASPCGAGWAARSC